MSPELTLNNFVKDGARNSKLTSHAFTFPTFVKRPNIQHVRFGELVPSMIDALGIAGLPSVFMNAVSKIVCSCSKKQVIRSNTRRIVALVKNAKAIGGAIMDNPACNMCSDVSAPFSVSVKVPITVGFRTNPQPAPPAFGLNKHAPPKPFREVFGQFLRFKKFDGKLVLHKSVLLICATLSGGYQTPRGHFYCGWCPSICQ